MPHIDLAAAPVGAVMPPAAMDGRATVAAGFAEALADAQTATASTDPKDPLCAEAVLGSPEPTRAARGDVRRAAWNALTRLAPQLASGAGTEAATASATRPAAVRESTETPTSGTMVRPQITDELVQAIAQTPPPITPVVAPGTLPVPAAVPAAVPPPPGEVMFGDAPATGTGGIKPIRAELLQQPGGHAVSVVQENAEGTGEPAEPGEPGGPSDAGVGSPQIQSAPGMPGIPGTPGMAAMPGGVALQNWPGLPGLVPQRSEVDPPGSPVPGAASPPGPIPGGPGVPGEPGLPGASVAGPPRSGTGGSAPGVTAASVPGVPMTSRDTRLAPGTSTSPGQEVSALTASPPGRAVDAPDRVIHSDARSLERAEGDDGAVGDRSKDETRIKAAPSMNALARTLAARFKANEGVDAPVAPGLRGTADVAEPGLRVGRGGREAQAPMPVAMPAALFAPLQSVPPPTAIGATAGTSVLETDRGQNLESQIVQAMRVQASANGGDARIRLQPNYLGELTISLKVENGNVVAHLAAATPEVRQWIESNEATLRQGLALHDLKLERLVVTEDEPATASGGESDTAEQYERRQSTPRRRPRTTDATFEVVV